MGGNLLNVFFIFQEEIVEDIDLANLLSSFIKSVTSSDAFFAQCQSLTALWWIDFWLRNEREFERETKSKYITTPVPKRTSPVGFVATFSIGVHMSWCSPSNWVNHLDENWNKWMNVMRLLLLVLWFEECCGFSEDYWWNLDPVLTAKGLKGQKKALCSLMPSTGGRCNYAEPSGFRFRWRRAQYGISQKNILDVKAVWMNAGGENNEMKKANDGRRRR